MIGTGRRILTAATAVALVAVGVAVGSTSARATTPPTYEPDPGGSGTLSFYDASGNQITSGTYVTTDDGVGDPMAAYYRASGHGVTGDINASVAMATPQDGVPTQSWTTVNTQTSSQPMHNDTYPGILGTTNDAVVKGDDFGLGFQIFTNPSASTDNPDIYQIRLYTLPSATYYTADVMVDAGTWTQVYPTVLTPTSTTLASAPNPSAVGQDVTLTATVTPSDLAGSVQFKDGSTNLGAPVTVSAGQAETSVSFSTGGSHSLRAVFTPTDTSFATSTGNATHTVTADNSALTTSKSTTIKYGSSTITSTTLRDTTMNLPISSASVRLQRKSGSNWVTVATVTTSSTGKASKSVKPTGKITYRWSYVGNATHKAANSGSQTVSVTPVVSAHSTKSSVRKGTAFKIWGTLNPPSSGQKVNLQRQAGTSWNTIATVTIKKQKLPNGKTSVGFVFTVKPSAKGTFKYRVHKAATSALEAANSATLTVKVT